MVRPIKMLDVEVGGTGASLEYPATIMATQHAAMAFEVQGRISEFLVKEGTRVKRGDVLARLDDRDYQANLEVARANFRKARADYERSKNIFRKDSGAISLDEIESDRRELEVTEAKLRQAEKAVEDTVLRALFDGIMARKLVDDFENVQAKEPVLILQDNSRLEVRLNVPERDVARTTVEMPLEEITAKAKPEVMITSMPGRVFRARFKEFATTADPVTRTFQAKMIFDNPGGTYILPGMTARVKVNVPRRAGVWIPANAVLSDADGHPFVWQVDAVAMTVSPLKVRVSEMAGAEVEVTGGLVGGELIAITGIHQLRDGMRVRRYEKN